MREAEIVRKCRDCGHIPMIGVDHGCLAACHLIKQAHDVKMVVEPKPEPEHAILIGFMASKLAVYEPNSGTVKWALAWLAKYNGEEA